MRARASGFIRDWRSKFKQSPSGWFGGSRLGAPDGQQGEWVHFGYRDGISEVVIDGMQSDALDPRPHAVGALLLGHPDDRGSNHFCLPRLPEKARTFFHHGSFGIFRPVRQDVHAFEHQVGRWVQALNRQYTHVTADLVKAKLCGRWPDGRTIGPGDAQPVGANYQLGAALAGDVAGEGCPFGSHARRMRPAARGDGVALPRPLQRRSVPFGPANWTAAPDPRPIRRGLLGHFFCASIESQFEHLVGQWAARAPVGFDADNTALDPLSGPHDDSKATFCVPLKGYNSLCLQPMGHWTTTLGTLYAWYPDRDAFRALVEEDWVPEEDMRSWL